MTGTYNVKIKRSKLISNVVNVIRDIFDLFEVSSTGELVDPPSADVYYATAEQEDVDASTVVRSGNSTNKTKETDPVYDYIFGSLANASAIRSVSRYGIELEDTIFTKNYRAVRFFFFMDFSFSKILLFS